MARIVSEYKFMPLHFEDHVMAHPRLNAIKKSLPAEPLVLQNGIGVGISRHRPEASSSAPMDGIALPH